MEECSALFEIPKKEVEINGLKITLTGLTRRQIKQARKASEIDDNFAEWVLMAGVINPKHGTEEWDLLGGGIFEKVFAIIWKLSGYEKSEEEEEKKSKEQQEMKE